MYTTYIRFLIRLNYLVCFQKRSTWCYRLKQNKNDCLISLHITFLQDRFDLRLLTNPRWYHSQSSNIKKVSQSFIFFISDFNCVLHLCSSNSITECWAKIEKKDRAKVNVLSNLYFTLQEKAPLKLHFLKEKNVHFSLFEANSHSANLKQNSNFFK